MLHRTKNVNEHRKLLLCSWKAGKGRFSFVNEIVSNVSGYQIIVLYYGRNKFCKEKVENAKNKLQFE
jgi:hypothetical protein